MQELSELARAGMELVEIECPAAAEILAAAEDCDALLVVSSPVSAAVIERLSCYLVIARYGAGPDTVDVNAVTRHGILTPHSAGSSVESSLESKIREARNAADVLLGIRPRHIVNPECVPRFPLRVE